MRRLVSIVLVLGSLGGAAALAHGSRSTAVGVGEREFRISVYRPVVPPGTLRLNVINRGEDDHDLAVLDAHGRVLAQGPVVPPGGRGTLRVTLRPPGSYRLGCTLA